MVHLNIQTCVYMCMIWGIESDRLPHQLQVAFLLHPASPAQRVLVAHATGSGKPYELVAVVQNLFPMRMNTRALIYLVLHVLIWHLKSLLYCIKQTSRVQAVLQGPTERQRTNTRPSPRLQNFYETLLRIPNSWRDYYCDFIDRATEWFAGALGRPFCEASRWLVFDSAGWSG